MDCSPWSHKESDATEHARTSLKPAGDTGKYWYICFQKNILKTIEISRKNVTTFRKPPLIRRAFPSTHPQQHLMSATASSVAGNLRV